MSAPSTPTAVTQYLTFLVAGEPYGVRVLQVQEILEYRDEITRVPNAPPAVRGVLNLRGRVVPVIDLAVRFGFPPAVPGKQSCVVIVEVPFAEGHQTVLGLLTDAVDQVVEIGPDDLRPLPTFGTRVQPDLLEGLAMLGERFVVLLDLAAVARPGELLEPLEVHRLLGGAADAPDR